MRLATEDEGHWTSFDIHTSPTAAQRQKEGKKINSSVYTHNQRSKSGWSYMSDGPQLNRWRLVQLLLYPTERDLSGSLSHWSTHVRIAISTFGSRSPRSIASNFPTISCAYVIHQVIALLNWVVETPVLCFHIRCARCAGQWRQSLWWWDGIDCSVRGWTSQ